jgi:mannose-1-phosphate guanylyltransferase
LSTHVVIIAGGAGTRFWPGGRRRRPKQLLPITSDRTMLAETLERCAGLAPPEDTWIVTNAAQREATGAEASHVPEEQLIGEPLMRNTAAAIGLAAGLIARRDPEAIMIVLPADHAIRPASTFVNTFKAAAHRAERTDVLLTVGIRPRGPATGYGYIEMGDHVATVAGYPVHRVNRFKEKPDAATAAEFLSSGDYLWNSGMFVWRVATLLAAFDRHLPGHAELLREIVGEIGAGRPAPEELYARFEKVPIDIGILEKADNVEVIPAVFEWDDVGSWLALNRLRERDDSGNVVAAKHVGIDTSGCILVARDDHLVATLGVEDLIVVQTPDATLICAKDRAQEVRRLVALMGEEGLEEYL